MTETPIVRIERLSRRKPLLWLLCHYAVVIGAFQAARRWIPGFRQVLDAAAAAGMVQGSKVDVANTLLRIGSGSAAEAAIAMVTALFLSVPVAWVFHNTRQKRGYQQSLLHSLVILPVIVAGVTILVKNSLALSFGLGSILAAIKFRNTLEDTKDAAFFFLTSGIGLACGVQSLGVATVLSVGCNILVLWLWTVDVGREAEQVQGVLGEFRRRNNLARANGNGHATAVLDERFFGDLSPEAARRLRKRLKKVAG